MFRPYYQYASCVAPRRPGVSNTKSSTVKSRCKTRQLPTYARANGTIALREDTLHVVVAGGGLGGLFLAICLMRKGLRVTVIERTAEYRNFGGPIQLASNGMSVLKATSQRLYESVQQNSRPFWGTKSGIKSATPVIGCSHLMPSQRYQSAWNYHSQFASTGRTYNAVS